MVERQYAWDEISEGLMITTAKKVVDDEPTQRGVKPSQTVETTEIYSPHSYLMLQFHDTLNPAQRMKFRRYFLRKVLPDEPNVIILQDIKDLVLFLLITPITPMFINFFHLPPVDNFLRALILYFQYYIEIWEELMKERAATMKKAPNPLAGGNRLRYGDELHILRCVVGKEYANLLAACQDTIMYHHMVSGRRNAATVTRSQGEKDLRIYEVLIHMAHRVVWIALQRKHFHLIEAELHRLLRTEMYNTSERRNNTTQDMLENDLQTLQGSQEQFQWKLARNSPLIWEILYSDCDFRVLSLGLIKDDTKNPRIEYLRDALFVEEEKLAELGLRVGILGHQRTDYDIMLMLIEEEEDSEAEEDQEKEKVEETVSDKLKEESLRAIEMPAFGFELELPEEYPMEAVDSIPNKYAAVREAARKRWIIKEINRYVLKQAESFSGATTISTQ